MYVTVDLIYFHNCCSCKSLQWLLQWEREYVPYLILIYTFTMIKVTFPISFVVLTLGLPLYSDWIAHVERVNVGVKQHEWMDAHGVGHD